MRVKNGRYPTRAELIRAVPGVVARRLGLAVVPLLLTLPSLLSAADPPFFQPAAGFYHARGKAVRVEWHLDRIQLPADGVLTATLTVRGADNPQEITRPDLAKLRDDEGHHPFADRFQIDDVPGPPVSPGAKEVSFVYRLRPRSRDVDRLPALDFWYDTGVKVGNPFQKARAKGIDITVTAAARPKPAAVPLAEPEHLFVIATGPRVLGREPFRPGWWAWVLLVAAGPVVAAGWYAAWRRVYPGAARLARLRRTRAARRAADAIRRAGRAADPAGAVAAAVLGYLRARFPLPPGADTPAEVGEALHAAGLPNGEAEAVVDFLRRCDEARFAPGNDTGLSLAADAEAAVTRLEAVE